MLRRDVLRTGVALACVLAVKGGAAAQLVESSAKRFDQLLTELSGDPEFAAQMRRKDQFNNPFGGRYENAPIRTEKSNRAVSSKASDLIVACEVTNAKVYTTRYQSPVWPQGQSGITVGVGYDIGYTTGSYLKEDWVPYLDASSIAVLSTACGIHGQSAAKYVQGVKAVRIGWSTALSQYSSEILPRYVGLTEAALPNTTRLSEASLGALVSLVYNRGASFSKKGDQYLEMRNVRDHMSDMQFEKIPAEFRSMKRLWQNAPNQRGLLLRREAEASLFELGIAS